MPRGSRINHYRFSPEQVARCVCNDCSVNVIEAGDYCMVSPAIWEDRFGLGWNDNLCIDCIERRLGRPMMWLDADVSPSVQGYLPSPAALSIHLRSGMMKVNWCRMERDAEAGSVYATRMLAARARVEARPLDCSKIVAEYARENEAAVRRGRAERAAVARRAKAKRARGA